MRYNINRYYSRPRRYITEEQARDRAYTVAGVIGVVLFFLELLHALVL